MTVKEMLIHQIKPHPGQVRFVESKAKRKVIRAGRRSGKTTGIAYYAVEKFLEGNRILYAAPTQDQLDRFWHEIKLALDEPLRNKIFYKNETLHIIELLGTEQRIRAKTAWNADTLRGDYADVLIFDEWQLMNEDAWGLVGVPMLLDNNGDAVFIYTPPSVRTRSVTKATDPRHAPKLFKRAKDDKSGRWEAFHFSSQDNPHISKEALKEIIEDMTPLAYRMEILAEDIEYVPGALWTPDILDDTRVTTVPDMHRIIVAIDPAASTGQTGIIVAGAAKVGKYDHGFVLEDVTTKVGASPSEWAGAAVAAYHDWGADQMIGEINNGGDMIETVLKTVRTDKRINYKTVRASRGKHTRAEPISALFNPPSQADLTPRGHLCGRFEFLEEELCTWTPGDNSPNRLDAMVWAFVGLKLKSRFMAPVSEMVAVDPNAFKPKRRGQ